MTIIAWLLTAHFVGDWLLQNDWMARGKATHCLSAACLTHCAVYTATFALLLPLVLPLTPTHYLLLLAYIFVTHWLIDGGQLANRWGGLIGQTDTAFVRIVVDQIFHLLTLVLLTLRL